MFNIQLMEYLQVALYGLITAFVLSPIVIGLLYKLKFQQQGKIEVEEVLAQQKKSRGTPVMGGIIIIFTVLLWYFILGLQNTLGYLPVALIGFGALIGFLDDFFDLFGKRNVRKDVVYSRTNPILYANYFTWYAWRLISWPFRIFTKSVDSLGSYRSGLSSSNKFFMEILLAGVISYFFYKATQDTTVWLPFLGEANLGVIIVAFNTFVMVAFSRAFSVSDGMDGLSAGTHTIAFLALGLLAIFLGRSDVAVLCFLLMGAELAFYYFNIPPARVEMSDVGTIPLGMLFALIGIMIDRTLILVIIGGVFVMEIASSLIQTTFVAFFSRKVFRMAPIHHHFEIKGWSREKIVMRFYFFTAVLSMIGILIAIAT